MVQPCRPRGHHATPLPFHTVENLEGEKKPIVPSPWLRGGGQEELNLRAQQGLGVAMHWNIEEQKPKILGSNGQTEEAETKEERQARVR